ncbi:hypothetical protein J6590_096089 [Homalodisca vitripennis]|nr:hypothetical protein J6590_096089 [Homalodisca vitripennis]
MSICRAEDNFLIIDLGLRPDQEQVLTQEVSVVINGAASLRLEWGLKAAVESKPWEHSGS